MKRSFPDRLRLGYPNLRNPANLERGGIVELWIPGNGFGGWRWARRPLSNRSIGRQWGLHFQRERSTGSKGPDSVTDDPI